MPHPDRDQDGKDQDDRAAQETHPGRAGVIGRFPPGAKRMIFQIGAKRIIGHDLKIPAACQRPQGRIVYSTNCGTGIC
jgi:hypothetical protein